MDNVRLMDPNSCCSSLIKVNCWLILAKYRTSKLEVIKRATEEAALDEFETRLFLRNYYANDVQNDLFLNFAQKVYNKAMLMITDYICSPDWSMFYDEGNSSVWQLKNTIQNEIIMASSAFGENYHHNCASMFFIIRDQVLSMIESWSNVMYIYSNYISAVLSEIFNDKMKKIICKYQYYPHNGSFKWLCDELMFNCGHDRWDHIQIHQNDKDQFWFINETLNLHFFDEPFMTPYSYPVQSEEELVATLSHWLFRESISQLQSNTRRLVQSDHSAISDDIKMLRKEQLSDFLKIPVMNLELQLKTSSSELLFNFDISDGLHYFIPDSSITELYPSMKSIKDYLPYQYAENNTKIEPNKNSIGIDFPWNTDQYYDDEKSNFDLIDSIVSNKDDGNDADYGCKLSDIKEELESLCNIDAKITNDDREPDMLYTDTLKTEENYDKASIPKLQIKGRHELEKQDKSQEMYPAVQHKKRGRPKKIDDYSSNVPKNGQHKYSPEDVQDCSIWISDNFFEVAGNKPAIDRARMYELYTNYCLLKLCTPVDRALFGKIIRKVFPKLKSRRLIQNQVLKYHYVGLKPKYAELEQALLYSDSSSMNPSEIVVTYVPVEE